MPLIYAFADESGQWYGEPDARTDRDPWTDELVMDESQEDAVPGSPFWGKRLTVKIAAIEGPAGGDSYRVAGGRVHFTTATVEQLFANWRPYVDDDDEA